MPVIVRSPEAHAAITSIDTSAAKEAPGVVAVLTGEDMAADFAGPMAMVWAPPGVEIKTPEYWPLARGQVKHVGDPVAVVVGEQPRRLRSTRAEQVIVEYDPKPVVVDPGGRARRTARRSCGSRSAPTRRTSGRWPAATSTPRRPRPR